MVSGISITFMGITLAFTVIAAAVFPIFIRKKWQTNVPAYFIGWAVFLVFALILENIVNILALYSAGDALTGNMWLYALYGGLAAGVFEETGRFLAMKFVMKKCYDNPHNALMYGAGHGCFEALTLVGLTMVVNIAFSLMINAGQAELLLSSVTSEQREAIQTLISQLTDTPSYMWLLSGFERITAIMGHIAFSALVWTAVVKRKKLFFPLAIFIHAFVDGVLLILQQCGVDNAILELILFVMVSAVAAFTYFVWKRELRGNKMQVE